MPCQSHWQTTHKRAPPPPKAIPKWKIQNKNSNYEDHAFQYIQFSLRASNFCVKCYQSLTGLRQCIPHTIYKRSPKQLRTSNFCVKRLNKRCLVRMPRQSHWQTTYKRAPPPPRQYQSERYKMKTGTTKRTGYSLIAITQHRVENNLTETERKTSGPDALPKSLADYSQEGTTTSKTIPK